MVQGEQRPRSIARDEGIVPGDSRRLPRRSQKTPPRRLSASTTCVTCSAATLSLSDCPAVRMPCSFAAASSSGCIATSWTSCPTGSAPSHRSIPSTADFRSSAGSTKMRSSPLDSCFTSKGPAAVRSFSTHNIHQLRAGHSRPNAERVGRSNWDADSALLHERRARLACCSHREGHRQASEEGGAGKRRPGSTASSRRT